MKNIIIIAVSLIATSASAQQNDSYRISEAAMRLKMQVQRTQEFLGDIENISNARHCGVFKNYDLRIGSNIMRRLALEIFGSDYPAGWNNDAATVFRADIEYAWKQGTETTKLVGCDVWQKTPEYVVWIRNLEMGVGRDDGSLPYWFPSLQGDLSKLLDVRHARCLRAAYGDKANADWMQRRADYLTCLGAS